MARITSRQKIIHTRQKHLKPKLTTIQKAARREKFVNLTNDVHAAHTVILQETKDIASKHGRSENWTMKQLYLGTAAHPRKANTWNGFLREKMTEANKDLTEGVRYKLPKFIAENKEALIQEWHDMSQEEKDEYKEGLTACREEREKTVRANPKAVLKDVNSTFDRMQREWMGIGRRTGIEGFYFAVRGSVDEYSEPKVYLSGKAEKFFQQVLNIEPQELALKLEAWVVSGLDASHIATVRPATQLISICRKMIQDELNIIVRANGCADRVNMNYNNYEGKIVERYSVELRGWPEAAGTIRNPSKIAGGRAAIAQLHEALLAGDCKWIKLSGDELADRVRKNKAREAGGEVIYKKRKAQRQTAANVPKSADTIEEREGEDRVNGVAGSGDISD